MSKKIFTKEEKEKMEEERKRKVKELTTKLEEGITNMFTDGTYANYLKAMSMFHDYSLNNLILIHMQKPQATKVAGYTTWKNLKRQVKKGEKGISILKPTPYKVKVKEKDENGEETGEEKEESRMRFSTTAVYDISQTEGEDIDIVKDLHEYMEDCDTFIDALEKVSNYPYDFVTGIGEAAYFDNNGTIIINASLSDIEIIKHMITENVKQIVISEQVDTMYSKDIITESVAFVVCDHYGIDTSAYSFGQIAKWSENKELKELKASLDYIRKIASEMIRKLDDVLEN